VPLPASPSNLVASTASTSQINLTWSDNSNNETGFRVERSTNGVDFTQIRELGAGVKSYSDTNLPADQLFYYRVLAYNISGNSGYSNTASARTSALKLIVNGVYDNKNGKTYSATSSNGREPMDDLNTTAQEKKVEVESGSNYWWDVNYQDPTDTGIPQSVVVTLQYRPENSWTGTFTAEYWDGGLRLASVVLPASGSGTDGTLSVYKWNISNVVTSSSRLASGRVRLINNSSNGKKVLVSYSVMEFGLSVKAAQTLAPSNLVKKTTSGKIAALNSAMPLPEPFRLVPLVPFGADSHTPLTLFAMNLAALLPDGDRNSNAVEDRFVGGL